MTRTEAPRSIGWSVDPDGRGYTVRSYRDEDCDVYQAGNNPTESASWLPADHPMAVTRATLAKWAEQTAEDIAREFGLPTTIVFHDADSGTED